MEIRFCFHVTDSKYIACRDFYEKLLGWSVSREWNRGPSDQGVVFCVGAVHLELLRGGASEATRCDPSFYLYIENENLVALWTDLQALGCVPSKRMRHPWGHESFVVFDPAGFKLEFFCERRVS